MSAQTFLSEYFWYIYLIIIIPLFLYAFISWLRGRGKMQVLVQYADYEVSVWKKPEVDHKTIIMEKAKGKNPGWHFEFDNTCVKTRKKWLGRSYRAVEVFPSATKAISYNFSVPSTEQPKWDKKQSVKFIEARMLEKMGAEPKEKTGSILLIILMLIIVSIVLNFLLGTGRLRI